MPRSLLDAALTMSQSRRMAAEPTPKASPKAEPVVRRHDARDESTGRFISVRNGKVRR